MLNMEIYKDNINFDLGWDKIQSYMFVVVGLKVWIV